MDRFLRPGQLLEMIWAKGMQIQVDAFDIYGGIGRGATCLSLTVFMEKGQMGEVPWVRAEFDEVPTRMYNVALLQGYSLKEEE